MKKSKSTSVNAYADISLLKIFAAHQLESTFLYCCIYVYDLFEIYVHSGLNDTHTLLKSPFLQYV